MSADFFASEAQLDVRSNLVIAIEPGIGDLVKDDLPVRRSIAEKARTDGRWRSKTMRSSEEPKGTSSRQICAANRRGFLPDVPLPAHLPPEPVAIADMANMFGVTHRTLHFYEEKAIISSRRAGLMRIYSHQDVRCMAVVNFCREIGIPVASIQEMMQQLTEVKSQAEADAIFQNALNARKNELSGEISTVRRQIQQISDVLVADFADSHIDDEDIDEAEVQLDEREQKCLELMAEGYAPVRLARTLNISTEELQKLEACVMEKLNANNRFQAVAKAFMLGVISHDREAISHA